MNKIKHSLWLAFLIILLLTSSLIVMYSCSNIKQVPASSLSPLQTAPPLISPSILGENAYIIMNDKVLTPDVDFSIVRSGNFDPLEWAGDIIFYLDVKPPSKQGQPATTAKGTYQTSNINDFVSWKNVTAGKHSFSAQLVKSDLTPLDPPVDSSIEIEVPSSGTDKPFIRSLTIQMLCSPGYRPPEMPGRPTGTVACADIVISSDVHNFKIVDKIGYRTAPGEGHFIYYFNVTPPTIAGQQALTEEGTYAISVDSIASWLGVLPGEYKVWVQLVNNDNTPLEPPVLSGGTVIVPLDVGRY